MIGRKDMESRLLLSMTLTARSFVNGILKESFRHIQKKVLISYTNQRGVVVYMTLKTKKNYFAAMGNKLYGWSFEIKSNSVVYRNFADRLTNWTINSTVYSADYSGNGNIVRKSDFGLYAYSSSRPHAVSGISSLIAGICCQ